jgi:hypothetical protein
MLDQMPAPLKVWNTAVAELDGYDAFVLEYDDVADSPYYHVYLTLVKTK